MEAATGTKHSSSSNSLRALTPNTRGALNLASQLGGQRGRRLRWFEAQQACLVHLDAGKLPQDVIL
jgi:hypothetical protein